MKEGSVLDEVDSCSYPDPLSFNLNNFSLSQKPEPVELTDISINKFWMTTYEQYGVCEYDDIVLSLNGVAHRNFLKEGQVILFPVLNDIGGSFSRRGA